MQDNTTLKQAYNQLKGNAIYKEFTPKEGSKYKAWETLDFKNTDINGNYETKKHYKFDLEKELNGAGIKEMQDPTQKERLMESLQRGNRPAATVIQDGKEQKLFIGFR